MGSEMCIRDRYLTLLGLWALPTAGLWSALIGPSCAVGLVILVGRLRAQQVVFGHHAVHGTLSRRWPWLNAIARHATTAIPLAQNPVEYKRDHFGHHRVRVFTTAEDSDAAFLQKLGFLPGMSRRALYAKLWATVFSPRFHATLLASRVRSALQSASWTHRAFVLIWLSALAVVAVVVPWWVFVAGVVLPMAPMYHVSALLQFVTEHRWLVSRSGPKGRQEYADRCAGRFALLPPPEYRLRGAKKVLAWSWWTTRMLPEVLVRLGVWVGDLPAHDHHHLAGPLGHDPHDWDEAIYERQRAIDEGDEHGLAQRELYGLKAALDWVFDGLANAKV